MSAALATPSTANDAIVASTSVFMTDSFDGDSMV
jgi:hypothetical protein